MNGKCLVCKRVFAIVAALAARRPGSDDKWVPCPRCGYLNSVANAVDRLAGDHQGAARPRTVRK